MPIEYEDTKRLTTNHWLSLTQLIKNFTVRHRSWLDVNFIQISSQDRSNLKGSFSMGIIPSLKLT